MVVLVNKSQDPVGIDKLSAIAMAVDQDPWPVGSRPLLLLGCVLIWEGAQTTNRIVQHLRLAC